MTGVWDKSVTKVLVEIQTSFNNKLPAAQVDEGLTIPLSLCKTEIRRKRREIHPKEIKGLSSVKRKQ